MVCAKETPIRLSTDGNVFAETLRLYSPVGQLFRVALNDYKVPGMDLVIEKGMPIMIPVHAIHHDSRYYYDPEHYNPDRFAPEEVQKRPHFTFLPFGNSLSLKLL